MKAVPLGIPSGVCRAGICLKKGQYSSILSFTIILIYYVPHLFLNHWADFYLACHVGLWPMLVVHMLVAHGSKRTKTVAVRHPQFLKNSGIFLKSMDFSRTFFCETNPAFIKSLWYSTKNLEFVGDFRNLLEIFETFYNTKNLKYLRNPGVFSIELSKIFWNISETSQTLL